MGAGLHRAFAATAATRRTPQQQADDFMAANDRNPVIAGAALEENPERPSRGARYKTTDGKWHYVGASAHKLLRAGYPRWQIG